jgi:cold shock CspA family protein
MPTGKIVHFCAGDDGTQGYGFLKDDDKPRDRKHNVFFPAARVKSEWPPERGDRCEFEYETNPPPKGPKALSVTITSSEEITRTGGNGWD